MNKVDTLLTNCSIIDVENGEHFQDGAICILNEKITKVGKTGDIQTHTDADKIIDLKGLTVIPGLINTHVHLCLSGEDNPNLLSQSDITTTINVINNSYKTLISGVTTVRDCGCKGSAAIEVSKAIERTDIKGPRIIATGNALLMTGGHGKFIGREVDGIENIRKAAREELKAGAKALKVIATGGVLSPGTEIGSPELSYEEIAVVVEEARKRGVTVAAHAIGLEGIMNAVKAGVDSIEHGSYLDDRAIKLMREKGIFHVPTLTAYHSVVRNSNDSTMDLTTIQKANQAESDNTQSFIKSRQANVNFATGTDAGTPRNPHGSISLELSLMTACGVSNLEALRAATLYGAKLLKIDEEVGSISKNKLADLLVIGDNPLENIESLKKPKLVMRRGEIVFNSLTEVTHKELSI